MTNQDNHPAKEESLETSVPVDGAIMPSEGVSKTARQEVQADTDAQLAGLTNLKETKVDEGTQADEALNKKEKKKRTVGQEILSWVGTLLLAVVIALAVRIFLAEPIRVDGRSMQETLQNGEIVLVTKPSVLLGNLNRGDVVICRFPNRNSTGTLQVWGPLDISLVHHEMFVKRLVALPGDSVEIREKHLYVNDQLVQEDYITHLPTRDLARVELGEDQYMVIGDNRSNSHDSRSADVGPISKNMIVGKAAMVLLPLNKIRIIK